MTSRHIPRARKSLQLHTLALKRFIYPDITVPEPLTTTPDRKTPPRSGKPLYTPIHPRARMYTPDTRVYPSYTRLPGSREFIMVPFAPYPYILCYFRLYFQVYFSQVLSLFYQLLRCKSFTGFVLVVFIP